MTRATFFSLLAACFLAVSTSALFAQSIWTGGAGTTNWNTPGNWTGGVPNATKTVTINTCSTCPRISTSGNQSKFVQIYAGGKLTIVSGGSLTIENPGGPGMKTHATSQVQINQGGGLTIQNFWGEGLAIGGTFTNGGNVSINGGHTGIAVSAGASFTNNANGTTSVTGSSLNYGMTSSGTVQNNGIFNLDDANNDGINQPTGTITNGVNGTLTLTKTGVNAIFAKGTFNNNGVLNIDNGLNGIYLLFGTFNNNANGKLTITGTSFLNEGIYVDPGTFKNSGELTIQNALSKGIEISGGSTFNNFNKILLNVPAWAGIFNVGGSNFTNKPCARIETNAAVVNYATFTNSGIIWENSSGNSQIGQNNGSVINLNGGSFSVSGGNEVIAESGTIVWMGCASTNWTDANNWFPAALPVAGLYSKAIVQNVAQASGNAPKVSSAVVSPFIYLHNGANLTIASGGSLGISDGMLGNGYLEVRQVGTMTVQAGGSFSSSAVSILGGNIQNGGSFTLPAPFHSAGSFGMNGGTFNNLSGGTFTGTVGQAGSGVNANLSNGASFTNSGGVTISGFGGFFLNQSTLKNNASGSIGMPSGGRISNLNLSTVTNNGSIAIYRQSPEGIRCENSTFTNTGGIGLSFTNIVQYDGTFTNSGNISISSPTGSDGIVNAGTFSSSGNISVQQSGEHHGILNLLNFSTGAGSLTVLDHTSNGVINFGTFSNGGTLDVNTTNYARGIESQGTFVNQTTGKIFIKNTVGEGLVNFNSFSNHGIITVENIPTQDGIATTGFFENSVFGKITVNNVMEAGFWVFGGTCNNAGQISTNTSDFEGLLNGGNFTNTPTGSISVKNAAAPALTNFATFTNSGSIHAEDSGEGLRNHQIFNSSGDITFEGCYVAGVVNFKQMTNTGTLIVNVSPANQTVHNGFISLDDEGGASFTNSGSVQIANIKKGMELEAGTSLTNSGSLEIFGDGQMDVGIQNFGTVTNVAPGLFYICCALQQSILNTGGTFTNQPCAVLDVDQVLVNTSTFQNRGLLKTTASGSNLNTGTFTNTGVIEDFYGSFEGVGITNAAVRVRPISGMAGGFILNALEIGFNSPFAIGTTWFLNENLSNPAGTYNPGVNTFAPTVGVGTHTLYFTAEDLVNNCRKTVSIQVNIVSAFIAHKFEEANITLYNYPNPFAEYTVVNFSLPFDTEGRLAIYDGFGRLVEMIYEGEMRKDALFQFEFNGSDKRLGMYAATLVLKDGRAYSIPMLKADNR